MPDRVQLRRTKGWRIPEGCRKVDRSTRYGNPFHVWRSPSGAWAVRLTGGELLVDASSRERAARASVDLFGLLMNVDDRPARVHLAGRSFAMPAYPTLDELVDELRGLDLACWCPIGSPCHADTILEVVNRAA